MARTLGPKEKGHQLQFPRDAHQPNVVCCLQDQAMEGLFQLNPVVPLVRGGRMVGGVPDFPCEVVEPVTQSVGLAQFLGGHVLGRSCGGEGLQGFAQVEQLFEFPSVDAAHIGPSAADVFHQPLGSQLVDRFADGGEADADLRGQGPVHQPVSRQQFPAPELGSDGTVGLFGQGLAERMVQGSILACLGGMQNPAAPGIRGQRGCGQEVPRTGLMPRTGFSGRLFRGLFLPGEQVP